VPAVFLAVHTPEFLGIDQTIWIILATVVTGAATLMLAFLAVMTIAQGRKDRAFSAAPVLIIESGLSEQISIHSGAEESLLGGRADIVVKLEIWDPVEMPPVACHEYETVLEGGCPDTEIGITDQ
jgi:hypothetical protein